jgi:hypothetical protein
MSHASFPSGNPPKDTVRSSPDLAPLVVSRTTGNPVIVAIRFLPPVFRYEAIPRLANGSKSRCSHLGPMPRVP